MSNKTILFADDSATMRTIMEKTFVAEPFDVVTVPSGEAAINQAKTLRPDVIVVDAGMAGVSGYDVCQAVRDDAGIRSIPLIIMSGVSNLYDEGRGETAGVTQHVKKPFDTGQLIQLIAELGDRPKDAVEEKTPDEEVMPISAIPEPISSLESLSEPPEDPISIIPDDEPDEMEAPLPEVEVEAEDAPEVSVEAAPEPLPLSKSAAPTAASISSISMDGEESSVGKDTKEFGLPRKLKVKTKPESPGRAEENDFGEVALDVDESEADPATPDVAPIEIAPETSDATSASFQVGTLAELAQMDEKARPISPKSDDKAIDFARAKTGGIAAGPSSAAGSPMEGVVDSVRGRMDDAAKDVASRVEGISVEQAEAIQALTREVIERVVWEVVPDLAEVIIKEELNKLLEE